MCGIVASEALEEIYGPSACDIVSNEKMSNSGLDGIGEGRQECKVNISVPGSVPVNETSR